MVSSTILACLGRILLLAVTKQVFLRASSGRSYYYAHLNGFNVSDGASVTQGDLIGFNGNTGNAAGTSPHVHLRIYPTGYDGGVINPYHTMAAVCFVGSSF